MGRKSKLSELQFPPLWNEDIDKSSWTFHSRINWNEVLALCQTWYLTKRLQIQPSIDLQSSLLLTIVKQMLPVLIYFSYHNKIPQVGWSKSQKFVFSQFWRLEFKIYVPAGSGSGEGGLPGLMEIKGMAAFFLMGQREEWAIFWASSYKVTNPTEGGPHPYDLI